MGCAQVDILICIVVVAFIDSGAEGEELVFEGSKFRMVSGSSFGDCFASVMGAAFTLCISLSGDRDGLR